MALLAVLAVASAADAAIVTVSSATVDVGDTFTIAVSIDAAADLSALQFDLGFGPAFVQADGSGASLGPLLPADWFLASPGAVDNTLGVVLGVAAFGSTSQGGGALAEISFTAQSAGITTLHLSNVFLNLSDSGFTAVDGTVCVRATAGDCGHVVPEPGVLALLLPAAAALMTSRSRRKAGPA